MHLLTQHDTQSHSMAICRQIVMATHHLATYCLHLIASATAMVINFRVNEKINK